MEPTNQPTNQPKQKKPWVTPTIEILSHGDYIGLKANPLAHEGTAVYNYKNNGHIYVHKATKPGNVYLKSTIVS